MCLFRRSLFTLRCHSQAGRSVSVEPTQLLNITCADPRATVMRLCLWVIMWRRWVGSAAVGQSKCSTDGGEGDIYFLHVQDYLTCRLQSHVSKKKSRCLRFCVSSVGCVCLSCTLSSLAKHISAKRSVNSGIIEGCGKERSPRDETWMDVDLIHPPRIKNTTLAGLDDLIVLQLLSFGYDLLSGFKSPSTWMKNHLSHRKYV